MKKEMLFNCAKCGGTKFKIPANPNSEDVISCLGCGATGKYGDVIAEAESQAIKLGNDIIRDAFTK